MGYDCVADADVMKKVNDFFKPIRNDYIADGTLMPLAMVTDTDALNYKVPGGMLSNLFSQLKQQNALDRLNRFWRKFPA